MDAVHAEQPIFYYELGSPACYLAAETVISALSIVPEWEPVHAAALPAADLDGERAFVELSSARHGLQPLRWPAQLPADTRQAMLAATYAKHIGRAVAFSLACFRQAFAAGRDLGEIDTVLIAGAACEMHPSAIVRGIELRSVREGLERAGERALAAGIQLLPAVQYAGRTWQGRTAVEQAAAALGAAR